MVADIYFRDFCVMIIFVITSMLFFSTLYACTVFLAYKIRNRKLRTFCFSVV